MRAQPRIRATLGAVAMHDVGLGGADDRGNMADRGRIAHANPAVHRNAVDPERQLAGQRTELGIGNRSRQLVAGVERVRPVVLRHFAHRNGLIVSQHGRRRVLTRAAGDRGESHEQNQEAANANARRIRAKRRQKLSPIIASVWLTNSHWPLSYLLLRLRRFLNGTATIVV